MDIRSRLNGETLVLDGAMGTMIMKAGLEEHDFRGKEFASHPVALKGCNDVLCLTAPELISTIHTAYLEAGADIISTDTFNSNSISLAKYGLSDRVEDICRAGVRLAREAVDQYCHAHNIGEEKRPYVAGSMGPTGVALSISMQDSADPAADFDRMANAFRQQAGSMIEEGADLLLVETLFDALNAKAAMYGINQAFADTGKIIPISISATIDENGRLLSGQDLRQFVEALRHARPLSFGLNCGFGAKALIPFVRELSQLPELAGTFISIHPNAGHPDEMGRYLDTPDTMAEEADEILRDSLVNIIGGCCGTTPEHIRRIARLTKSYPVRGLTAPLRQDKGFIKVGERCNVAGSRKFLRLVAEKNWKECIDIAADQVKKGAGMLDVNMDDAMLDAGQCICSFLTRLYADGRTSSMPVMIDSSDFEVCKKAMRLLPLKGVVNSISLKNGDAEFLERAEEIRSLGCSMVVMAFDERGQADTFDRKIEICRRSYDLLVGKGGIDPEDIIFDPNVLAVATGIATHDSYAADFIRATEWIKRNLPGAKVSGGVSNLSFSFRGIDPVRKAMHSVFLEQNIHRGMDMAIINPATPLDSAWIEDELLQRVIGVIENSSADASDRLLEYAMQVKRELDAARAEKRRGEVQKPTNSPAELKSSTQLLTEALMNGDTENLERLVAGSLSEHGGSAMEVVEQALLSGMDRVGERFGAGEMFLPQVVRSSTVMKRAFDILTPLIEDQQRDGAATLSAGRPVVVLATVKGDVHDIGKNIVAVVLRCSGFEVVDLGVMVEPEKIVDTAISVGAAAIGLSGLITPSLQEMGVVAAMMERKGMDIPLFIGGATTSDLHTAVKLAPLYSGAVVHTSDAASLPKAIKDFISSGREEAVERLKEAQIRLRDLHPAGELLTLREARSRGSAVAMPSGWPLFTGTLDYSVRLAELRELINWRAFLGEWKLNPADAPEAMRSIETGQPDSSEAGRLIRDALGLLDMADGVAKARVAVMYATTDDEDSICLGNGVRIPTVRGQRPNPMTGRTLALSDFVHRAGDHLAIFAVTLAGSGLPEMSESLKTTDPYRSLLYQSLSHRLAEAATEWLHRRVSTDIWGSESRIGVRPAVGYPSLPDQSIVFLLDKVLHYSDIGITLTSHGAMMPSATTTGLIIVHPEARYFDPGPITDAVSKRPPLQGD